jgi:hypothetical protein
VPIYKKADKTDCSKYRGISLLFAPSKSLSYILLSGLIQNAEEINPLNSELNRICHLLALLGARHIFHVSGLSVNGDHQCGFGCKG